MITKQNKKRDVLFIVRWYFVPRTGGWFGRNESPSLIGKRPSPTITILNPRPKFLNRFQIKTFFCVSPKEYLLTFGYPVFRYSVLSNLTQWFSDPGLGPTNRVFPGVYELILPFSLWWHSPLSVPTPRLPQKLRLRVVPDWQVETTLVLGETPRRVRSRKVSPSFCPHGLDDGWPTLWL